MKWLLIFLLIPSLVMAQDAELPYKAIGDYPDDYGPGNVLSRMVDGLGYRYYWASEGLTETDLAYKIEENSRSTRQTLEHLHGLSRGILSASRDIPFQRQSAAELSYEDLRGQTLTNLKMASEAFSGKSTDELSEMNVIFQNPQGNREFELWHVMNGFIADALYHTGQIVTYRRASGNPLNPKVNVFMGRNNE